LVGQLPNPTRYYGTTRYETALEIARHLSTNVHTIFLVTGGNFPDALTGSGLAARTNSPGILVARDAVDDEVRLFLQAKASEIDNMVVLGGEGAVAEMTVSQILDWLR